MNHERLARLAGILGAIAEAERLRLAGLTAQSAACRRLAAELRRRARDAASGRSGPVHPGELVAMAAWGRRLAAQALDAEARASAVKLEAQALRTRYAQSFARAQAITRLARRMGDDLRRQSARRFELMAVPSAPSRWSDTVSPSAAQGGDQPSSGVEAGASSAASGEALPGSPAIT